MVNQYNDKNLDKKILFDNLSIFSFEKSLKNYEQFKEKTLLDRDLSLKDLKTNFKDNDLKKDINYRRLISEDLVLALNNSEFAKSNEVKYYEYSLDELILRKKMIYRNI